MNEKPNQDLQALRHTAAHLLAMAVKDLYPGAHNAIGPAIEDGFYQDFDLSNAQIALSQQSQVNGPVISEKDLPKIEKRMRELVKDWGVFEELRVSVKEAQKLFKDNPYKMELIDAFGQEGRPITVNNPGPFIDLCKGGHVDNAKDVLKNFKLQSIAGAYWRGDESKKMLTRIYGTAFFTKEDLHEHLTMLEEAKKRDHRKLGQQLDLFTFSSLVGPGLPLFTPRGTMIRDELQKWLNSIQEPLGYQRVDIPHLAKPALYHTSGHWDKFGENLFHVSGRGEEAFVIKPMNCPHHTQIYAAKPRSYKELPLRFSEITKVYRDEQQGELLGLARVRSITQDDAHVFCRPDQIKSVVKEVIDIVQQFYQAFDFELDVHLSVRDQADLSQYLGDEQIWDEAEVELKSSLDDNSLSCVVDAGEAAFYGPKIDFVAIDSLRRHWQLATIQLDFNMPARFDLAYISEDGSKQQPVMIHRAIMGAVERFMAILLEHYAGALPLWLSPTQVSVLPISDDQQEYAKSIADDLRAGGIRVEIDTRSESIGKKIRAAETMKVPVMLIVGKKEVTANTVSVRSRILGENDNAKLPTLLEQLQQAIHDRR